MFQAIKAEYANVFKLAKGYDPDEAQVPAIAGSDLLGSSAAGGGSGDLSTGTFAAGEQLRHFTVAREEMSQQQEMLLSEVHEEMRAQVGC